MKIHLDDVLDRIEDYFETRQDVRDSPDGPRPNQAMQLLTDLRTAREAEYRRAARAMRND